MTPKHKALMEIKIIKRKNGSSTIAGPRGKKRKADHFFPKNHVDMTGAGDDER